MRFWIFLLLLQPLFAQKPIALFSPNGDIRFELSVESRNLAYSVWFQNQPLVEGASLDLQFQDFALNHNVRLGRARVQNIRENYELVVGKNRLIRDEGRELKIELFTKSKPVRHINFIVRAYNDGVAFRYQFPQQKNWQEYTLLDEKSHFKLKGNPQVHALLLPNYTTSHEGLYTSTTLQALKVDTLIDMPCLFQFSPQLYLAISEAALRDYAGMYLKKEPDGTLVSALSPLPGQKTNKVKAVLPHQTPWRVLFVGSKMGTILESNLLTHLNAPCAIKDVSWIKPGKATWTWWNGDVIKGANFPVGQNFASHQYYIDWCAANHIEYHSVIEHGNRSWYYTEGEGFDPPPPGADVTRPVDSLEMERLAAYSRSKGVGLRVWVHWKPLSEKLEEAFALYQKWNIKGLMVDFMDRDDQEMVNWVEKVLKTAAKYELHVQFHGAYKPTGLHRTYPNEFTKEGVLNLENLKWSNDCDPEHNLMIPFTRLIAGATDYHAGGFRAVPRKQYKANFIEPNVLGTRCHHLALYVVFESYLQLVSDHPQAYRDQPGFEFIQQVPTTWDETRILRGQIGDYIVTARRKGEQWYLGAMTDWTARELEINLDFLNPGKTYQATRFSDASDADVDPNHLENSSSVVQSNESLQLKLAKGGGQAIVFSPLK